MIYRGDSSAEAKMYRTEGLMTRLMNGGNPATVGRVGLWEAARGHVQPRNVSEESFLATTPFLSFTENREKAAFYAAAGEPGSLVPCADQFGEDTIIFELDTEGMLQDGQEGVFVLDYPCDYSRVQPLGPGDDAWDQAAAVRCDFCDPANKVINARVGEDGKLLHRVQLLRVPTFLRRHPERERYAGALEQAEKDREWLVYPVDYVLRLRGSSGRIPLARIWTAHRYTFVPGRGAGHALHGTSGR